MNSFPNQALPTGSPTSDHYSDSDRNAASLEESPVSPQRRRPHHDNILQSPSDQHRVSTGATPGEYASTNENDDTAAAEEEVDETMQEYQDSNGNKITTTETHKPVSASVLSEQDLSIPLKYQNTKYQHCFSQEKLHYTHSCLIEEDLRYSLLDALQAMLLRFHFDFAGKLREEINVTSHRVRHQRTESFASHSMISEQEELLQNINHITTRRRIIARPFYQLIDNPILRLGGILLMAIPFALSCLNMFVSWALSAGGSGLIAYAIIEGLVGIFMLAQLVVWIVFLVLISRNNVHIENQRKVLFIVLYVLAFVFAALAFIVSFFTLIDGASFTIACIVTGLSYISVSFHLLALIHVPHFRQEYFTAVSMHFSDTRIYSDMNDALWWRQSRFQKLQEYALVGCICGGCFGIVWTGLWYLLQLRSYKQHHQTYTDRTITVFLPENAANELIQKIWSLRDDIEVTQV